MKLKVKKNSSPKLNARMTKKARIRKKLSGTAERPRLCVFRSSQHIYGQIIDDVTGTTLASASSVNEADSGNGCAVAAAVGKRLAKIAADKKISLVVFDRNGFIYHGRVKAFADGAREAGLNF